MEKTTNYIELLKEIESLTRNGNTTEAVNRSGEMLATADAIWQKEMKSGKISVDTVERLAETAVVHVRALVASNEPTMATATAIAVLTQLSLESYNDINLDLARLELLNNAINALAAHIVRYETDARPDIIDHYTNILRYLLSLIYALYNRVNRLSPECHILPSVYLTLKQFTGENVPVDTPMIKVNGKDVDPMAPTEIYADMLGRLNALGIAG